MNYKINRIGLLNFWYFDDEEFNFFDGKLLLRGSNGSGKSVTMQSFIPLILDGDKRPSRLDPFGTKEKKIEDYLLGPSDGEQKDDATGYLYMELYEEKKDKYLTIGIGLHARKGRNTDFWGFIIKDGKRIGKDFELYKNYAGKVLMTKKELKANLGVGNEFTESAKEYKAKVNDYLFGFKELDAYDEFINVLLQLRSSKLSKDYNPTKLMEILKSVLQPLTNDDVRPISEALEDTNKTREKVEKLANIIKDLTNLEKVYRNYNEILLYNKALKVRDGEEQLKDLNKNIKEKQNNISSSNKRLNEIELEINKLEKEKVEVETKLASIDDKDLKNNIKEKKALEEKVFALEEKLTKEKVKLNDKIKREKEFTERITNIKEKLNQNEEAKNTLKDTIITISEKTELNEVTLNIKSEEINISYIKERINKYKIKLNQIKKILEEKEKLEEELSKIELELETKKKEKVKEETNKNNYLKKMTELLDDFKDNLNNLFNNSKEIIFSEDVRTKIFNLIANYNIDNYIEAKNEFQKEVKYYETKFIEEKTKINNKLTYEKEKLEELTNILDNIKSQKELEFVSDEYVLETEEELKKKNIPFTELYKVLEFKNDLNIQEKNKIEEILISTNILNAKIVPNKYLDKVKNMKAIFLKSGTKKNKNILKYFDIIDNDIVSREEITKILESISIDEKENSYITPEKFEFDFLIGYPSDKYESKYIGIETRRKEKEKIIKEYEEKIHEEEIIINNYENILKDIIEKINNTKEYFYLFPTNKSLEEINDLIKKSITIIETIEKSELELVEKSNKTSNEIKLKIEEINKLKENITLSINLASFNSAISLLDELQSKISELENLINNEKYLNDKIIDDTTRLNETKTEINEINNELNTTNKEYEENKSKKKVIEELLNNPDFKKLMSELEELTNRNNQIPEENNRLREEKGKLNNKLESLNKELDLINNDVNEYNLILELNKQILEKEYNLGYVYKDIPLNTENIINDLKHRENSTIFKAYENYIEAFNSYRQELLDYRLSTKEIFTELDTYLEKYLNLGLSENIIRENLNLMTRQDLETIYQGKKLNIYELSECLKAELEESSNYISIQERHLFEEILIKTVGNKIRDKIDSSKEWVKKINDIMKSTQIDSNLSFELEWKSKIAFTEDELDTREIVRLFKMDTGVMNDSDIKKLRKHFESQINRELEYNEKNNDSYIDIIFKVLDYRNWFEFKLYYKRPGQDKKELTNKVFSVISGGERAKSMYVPLFAAVYAKLLSARENALRIIALDEAFAGVDNTNINEMFNILKELNLDYILTSQSLWGDYAGVKELSICELFKDEVHKAVAVRHYKWNGHTKEVLL